MGEKIYVVDSNIILNDSHCIYNFGSDSTVVIPSVVIQEIDHKKKLQDEVGRNARMFSREIDALRESGKLHLGVEMHNGGILKVLKPPSPKDSNVYESFLDDSVDTSIIALAKQLQIENKESEVVLISRDTNVRVKADIEDVASEDYKFDKVANNQDELYTGYSEIIVDDDKIDDFYSEKYLNITKEFKDYPENHLFVLKSPQGKSALGKRLKSRITKLHHWNEKTDIWGVRAKNVQQKLALELLLDDNIPLVTITGKAGTGKTLLSLAVGLMKVQDERKYNKLTVARPIVPMGKDLGYLPGEKDEKLRPWMQPIYDNLEFLFDCKNSAELEKKMLGYENMIQIEALTYIRGRSIPYQWIIIDEAQNLSQHEVKTILTRVGVGSKVILCGDPQQIDHPYLDTYSNGLTYVIEKLKDRSETGSISLLRGERSDLAQICADLL